MLAFVTNALAWEPVIKERHWFGVKEFEEELYPHPGVGPCQCTLNCTQINNDEGELLSITLEREWSWRHDDVSNPDIVTAKPTSASSFNCWMDDSGDTPKPRFRFNHCDYWEVGKNGNPYYTGYGLKIKESVEGTIINIQHLNNGDKIVLEMYSPAQNARSAFLMAGSIEGVSPLNYYGDWPADGNTNCNIGNPIGVSPEYTYTGSDDGEVAIKAPGGTVFRCITIIYNDNNYKKATTRIDEIHDAEGNIGYEMTITGSGVLEDKRGAVPYLTMRYGAENDMTFSRFLGTVNGVKQYGTSSIVDETDPLLNSSDVQLQSPYRQRYEEQNKKSLVGKEYTVFTENEELSDQSPDPGHQESPRFNSIYPLYGNYFYFFPEVDGKFHVRFYCEGKDEHMCMWYKQNGDRFVLISEQGSSNLKMSTDNGQTYSDNLFGGGRSTLNTNYYEYTADFKKGGVYYLCSNPTIQTQESPIPRLISYSFIPSFRVDPLYNVVENGTTECTDMAQIYGGVFSDLNGDVPLDNITINGESAPRVKCLGNVKSAQPYFYTENNVQKLGFRDITYTYKPGDDKTKPINKGGAIVVNVRCAAGQATFVLTIAYKAAEAEWGKDADGNDARMGTNDQDAFVKRWDFFSGKGDANNGTAWDLGKYYNNYNTTSQSENTSSKLYKETHKADGLTGDWLNTYVNLKDEEEPIFKSVYDMEGDNADMIHETAGLLFFTESNLLGIFNENAVSTTSFADRYIGLMGPEELPLESNGETHPRALIIPKLAAGDRIAIKMGTYGNSDDQITTQQAVLKITNAQDAVGTPITSDYVIGGSGVNTGNDTNNGADITDKSQPWGEYHFISTGGDFKLEVKECDLLKIYSIVIYRNAKNNNADILSENELLGDEEHRQILNTEDFQTAPDNVELHMHYRGLNEGTNYANHIVYKTGNLQDGDIHVTSMTSHPSLWYTYDINNLSLPITPDKAKFGVFKVRLGVQTFQHGSTKYVTDYADCMIPVGYRETKQYPYTWDFTDLKKYVPDGINSSGTESAVDEADLRIWNNWNLRVKPDEWDGSIFVSGGQLYGGDTMLEETRGLGITHDNNNVTTMTGTATDETGGLSIGNGSYGFIVPQVAKKQAIYVRAHKVEGVTQKANYEISDGEPNYEYGKDSNKEKSFYSAEATDNTGDEVFALVIPEDNVTDKADVRLNFKGYEVKKIAVSTDPKSVYELGYATESRDHAIDASLLPYFTGKDVKTYVVSNPDYENSTLTLTDVGAEKNKYVIPKNKGSIIYYADNKPLDVFGKEGTGFHLFVPDMHDQTGKNTELDNMLVPNVNVEGLPLGMFDGTGDGKVVNYVLTNVYYMLDKDGNRVGDPITGTEEMFYRVSSAGTKLHKNSAYLQLPFIKVAPSWYNPSGNAKFRFIYDKTSELDDEPTAIELIENNFGEDGQPTVWYSLSGQKLSGKPTKSGFYIMNGKKVFIK